MKCWALQLQETVAQLAGFENIFDATVWLVHEDRGTITCRLPGNNAGSFILLETPLIRAESGARLRVGIRAGDILLAVGKAGRSQCPQRACRTAGFTGKARHDCLRARGLRRRDGGPPDSGSARRFGAYRGPRGVAGDQNSLLSFNAALTYNAHRPEGSGAKAAETNRKSPLRPS